MQVGCHNVKKYAMQHLQSNTQKCIISEGRTLGKAEEVFKIDGEKSLRPAKKSRDLVSVLKIGQTDTPTRQ